MDVFGIKHIIMRRNIAISAILVFFMSAFAQNPVFNNPDNRPYWGIRGSFDISIHGDMETNGYKVKMFGQGYGGSVGAVYHLPVFANLFFEPGMSLYYDTYVIDDLYADNGISDSPQSVDADIRKFGVRIPLTIGYRFDIWENAGISILTGPELTYGFTARVSGDRYKELGLPVNLYTSAGGHKRFNFLWGVGAGLDINRFHISIIGYFGLVNMMHSPITLHENVARVAFGYNF